MVKIQLAEHMYKLQDSKCQLPELLVSIPKFQVLENVKKKISSTSRIVPSNRQKKHKGLFLDRG